MPLLTRLYLLSACIYLVLALSGEVTYRLFPFLFSGLHPFPTLIHLYTLGWVTQMIMGVAFWMFPKPRGAQTPRGNETLVWVSFVSLNLGLILRTLSEPLLPTSSPPPWVPLCLAGSALCLWLGGMSFFLHILPRIR